MTSNKFLFPIICSLFLLTLCRANPLKSDVRPEIDFDDPDYIMELIQLGRSLKRANELDSSLARLPNGGGFIKRGLDLGLGRGFSGSQAAKHLMGLAAANYAGGPGRRKRSVDTTHPEGHQEVIKRSTNGGHLAAKASR